MTFPNTQTFLPHYSEFLRKPQQLILSLSNQLPQHSTRQQGIFMAEKHCIKISVMCQGLQELMELNLSNPFSAASPSIHQYANFFLLQNLACHIRDHYLLCLFPHMNLSQQRVRNQCAHLLIFSAYPSTWQLVGAEKVLHNFSLSLNNYQVSTMPENLFS